MKEYRGPPLHVCARLCLCARLCVCVCVCVCVCECVCMLCPLKYKAGPKNLNVTYCFQPVKSHDQTVMLDHK